VSVAAWAVQLAATPSPTPVEVPTAEQTSPGVLGFLVTFAVAVAAILLALSLTRHLRVVDRRAAQQAREDEETAGLAAEGAAGDPATPRGAAPGAAVTGDGAPAGDVPGGEVPGGEVLGGGASGDGHRPVPRDGGGPAA
jgi:hypothetical protein